MVSYQMKSFSKITGFSIVVGSKIPGLETGSRECEKDARSPARSVSEAEAVPVRRRVQAAVVAEEEERRSEAVQQPASC